MKKILFSIFAAIIAIGFVGCEYDDSALWGEVNSLKDRVLTLEQLCQQMNTNISSLQSLVSALQNQDYITSVTPIKQGNDVIGYTITFAKGEPITIYHGQDGKNGADGEDGKDGYTPVIGVDKDEDGVYYWTLDGEWLTDADGNKIPTSGKDGADGEDGEGGKAGMPELRIQGGYWYVSYDGGENWERLGRATGYDGQDGKDGKDGVDGDSFFKSVTFDDDYVIFVLNNEEGTTLVVPRAKGQESLIALKAVAQNGGEIALTGDVTLKEPLEIAAGKTVTIDLNGYSITAGENGYAIYNQDGGTLTITDSKGGIGVITGVVYTGADSDTTIDGGTFNAVEGKAYVFLNESGTLTINDATINGGTSYPIYSYGADAKLIINDATVNGTFGCINSYGTGSTVEINGGTFEMTGVQGKTSHIAYFSTSVNATINDGTFKKIGSINMSGTGGGGICVYGSGNLTITNGNFAGDHADVYNWGSNNAISIEGGTFMFNPTASFIADDYHVIEQDGVFCVVPEGVDKYVEADSIEEIKAALEDAGAAGAGSTVINLANGTYDMTNVNWTSINVDGYHGADIVYVNGNGAVIKGLTSALFAGGFAGGSGIVIKDLTIEDAVMSATNTQGYGAFVNCADSMDEITLENCHLINSTIITPNDGADESRIGGLVGWTAGYDVQNNGPVDSYITIKNCSVIGCTLKGAGSIGAICGHAGANAATYTTIEDCVVKDNNLISTDNGGWRVGVVVGTANNGQCEIKNITESGNVLEQTGKTAPEGQSNYYGRFVPSGTGTLTIDGVAVQ